MSVGKLGSLLVAKGLVTDAQLQEAIQHRDKNRLRLGTSLVQLGHVNEGVLTTFLSKQYGIPAVSLEGLSIPPELFQLIPKALCTKHNCLPLAQDGGLLTLAVSDPTNVAAVDDVRFLTNLDVAITLAPESQVQKAIERFYGESRLPSAGDLIDRGDTGAIEIRPENEAVEIETEEVSAKPVIRLINKLFVEALRRHASDIHLEPYEKHTRVRLRIDGALHEIMRLPLQLRNVVPARVKVMANLDISEKRLPQDGRIQLRLKEKDVDVRVSTVPTIYGEKVVMRLLDQGGKAPDLARIGMEPEQLEAFQRAARMPYGMVLVTGPTGSGKTTTLYGALSLLNRAEVNISTVEDPVEYTLLGVNQMQMKESIGMTFATALRSLLRQDPDVIMVGEIRDQETAEISVKAALTGHMVFSTIHTNDAASTISRLIHIGLEPFLITAAVNLVQAQRLVRVICPKCKEPDARVKPEDLIAAGVAPEVARTAIVMHGKGCDDCANTGFRGRIGIFEVMPLSEKIRNLIIRGSSVDEIKRVAVAEGMKTLRQSGLLKLLRGETTLEEVLNNSRPDGEIKNA